MKLPPWAVGPYELLRHGDLHLREGGDADLRIALISFDNAIELAVSTYLDLNPKQRGGLSFPREDMQRWLTNFHTRLEFLEHLVVNVNKRQMAHDPLAMVFYHGLRNKIYHQLGALLPRAQHVAEAREAAVWVFSTLFGVDANAILAAEAEGAPVETPITDKLPPETDLIALYLELKREVADVRAASRRSIDHEGGRAQAAGYARYRRVA